MIDFNEIGVLDVYVSEKPVSEIYVGDRLVWKSWSDENLWTGTYVGRMYLNVSGKEILPSNGDRYEIKTMSVQSGDMYRLSWDDAVRGTEKNAPSLYVCFFDKYGQFIRPRLSKLVTTSGEGRYIITVPTGAVSMDIRIEDISSLRMQHFVGFKMNKN